MDYLQTQTTGYRGLNVTVRFTIIAALLIFSGGVAAASGLEPMPREWYAGSEENRLIHDGLVGQPMPPFELEDWRNGELTPQDLQGKIVLVDFWATWCGPCIATIPKRNQLQADYADRGVVVLGICSSPIGQDKYDQVLAQHPIHYPSARDASLEYAPLWHVKWMPTYAIVDRNGIIRGVGLQPQYVEDAIRWMLEEQPAALPEQEADQSE